MEWWLDFIINGVLFWFVIALLILQAYNVFFHKGIPNIRTAPALRSEIIQLLQADAAARGNAPMNIVDLGSGNGLFTREIAAALPTAHVIGVEIAHLSVLWSNWKKRAAKLDNLTIKRMNLLNYDFSDSDAIIMYLLPDLMNKLGKKLHAEAKPGTLILSNKFRLGDGWEPIETRKLDTLYLHQGELHIYRKA